MDEAIATIRARRLTSHFTMEQVKLPLESYLKTMNGLPSDIVLRIDESLGEGEAGRTVPIAGKRCIVINGNDQPERQRFTACHEVAHVVLDLPTEHDNNGTQFVRRSHNEVLCDVFAAEALLPRRLFQPLVEDSDLEFAAIERLASDFMASLAATGSCFAEMCDRPCAFVLAQDGIIRYASRSKRLKESGGWIAPGQKLPSESLAAQLLRSTKAAGSASVDAVEWLSDWKKGGFLLEEARHFPRWKETLSLLWFAEDRVPASDSEYSDDDDDEEPALKPLDGLLPWPGRSRRR